jgi:hypothetical protein
MKIMPLLASPLQRDVSSFSLLSAPNLLLFFQTLNSSPNFYSLPMYLPPIATELPL